MLAQGAARALCVDAQGRFLGVLTWREVTNAVAETGCAA